MWDLVPITLFGTMTTTSIICTAFTLVSILVKLLLTLTLRGFSNGQHNACYRHSTKKCDRHKNIMCWAKILNWTSFMQTVKALSILHICISLEPKPHVLVQMSIFVLFKRAEKSMVSLQICLV